MFRSAIVCGILLVSTAEVTASDHPISITDAQFFVTRNMARVRLTFFAEDLSLFHALESDDSDVIPADELKRGLEEHKSFLTERISLLDVNGERYDGSLTDIQPFEIPDEGFPLSELMQHSATFEFEYRFEEPPEFLTVQQDISDPNFIVPSEMRLTLHQAGTDMTFTEVLKPRAPTTIRFDWENAPLSVEATDAEWEDWLEKQRTATLGITSYSSVYSFIYIEPAEVRHEILIPLANLKTILPLQHEDPSFIEVDEQEGVRQLILEWLVGAAPALVNDVETDFEVTRIDFYGLNLRDFAAQVEAQKVSLASGRVGIILTYRPATGTVKKADLEWKLFPPGVINKIESVVISYPDMLSRFEYSKFNTPEENVLHWTVPDGAELADPEQMVAELPTEPKLALPVGTIAAVVLAVVVQLFAGAAFSKPAFLLLIAGAALWPFTSIQVKHPFEARPLIEEAEANDVFQFLHGQIYSALNRGSEESIYSALETSVSGDELETLYLQFKESLADKAQGGAIARVQSIDYSDCETLSLEKPEQEGFRYRARWKVTGTVEHWGHVHERVNQFVALFDISAIDGHWKITDMQVEEQKTTATTPKPRRF